MIYFLARKHPILLVGVLLLPVTLGMLALLGTVIGFTAQITWLLWLSVPVLGFMISLGVWNGVDWGNDYYIVTNQRVVWLEKVIGIYDSRQESPLSAIQRINVLTDFWGRQMDYGSLVVRTIVGSTLTLRNVNHPYQAAALIEDHWKRSQQSTRKIEEAAMRQALRERLIPKSADPMPAPPPSLFQQAEPKRVDIYGTPHGLGNIFRVRFEDLSTITYRKHWIVLIEKIWLSSLILLTLLGWLVYEITHISSNAFPTLIRNSSVGAFLILWLIIFLIIFGWWY